jgi:hypothetical protein
MHQGGHGGGGHFIMQIQIKLDTGLERTITVPDDLVVIALYLIEKLQELDKPVGTEK